ncbi:hypothetical protein ZIOFF_014195 [Zingiber officinale]|uniref:Transposase-associated domain-containing protein n=1 Tax=Zingiber officinale TaxID=94328 RepID=A0A8J5HPS0_ZINOF|nr:hypothetical protein ZIOFF_014195 [Zingiber officinale]
MTPDKKWMDLINDRLGEAYGQGIENFLDYAFERTRATNEIRCPCVKCANAHFGSREYVKMHLIVYGILQNYRFWYHHGEKPEDDLELHNSETEVDDNDYFMEDLLRDLHPHYDDSNRANINIKLCLINIYRDGQPPDFASMFFETRKKGDHIVDLDAMEKYDEICEVVREDSSLSNIQLVEKCFGPQRHDHVFGHGGGVRPKDVRGPIASKQELHHENVTLREKMNNMESEFKAFKELMLKNLPPNVQVTASASNTIEG